MRAKEGREDAIHGWDSGILAAGEPGREGGRSDRSHATSFCHVREGAEIRGTAFPKQGGLRRDPRRDRTPSRVCRARSIFGTRGRWASTAGSHTGIHPCTRRAIPTPPFQSLGQRRGPSGAARWSDAPSSPRTALLRGTLSEARTMQSISPAFASHSVERRA